MFTPEKSKLKDRFTQGESVFNFLDHDHLNSIEARLRRLENISSDGLIEVRQSAKGIYIALSRRVMVWEFCTIAPNLTPGPDGGYRVLNELEPFQDAVAYINHCDANSNLSYTKQDWPTIYVIDVFGISSQVGTTGIAFEHPRSQTKRWCFLPHSLGGGETKPGYDNTKNQALVHSGQGGDQVGGIVQWVDIDNCEAEHAE